MKLLAWHLMQTTDLIMLIFFALTSLCVAISLIGMTIRLILDAIRLRRASRR